jgi:hypothetical protein
VQPATIYIVAVGVNAYANPRFNLTYAVPDARTFAEQLGARQRAIDPNATVRVVTLLDGDATRDNILLALARLAGTQQGPLPAVAPSALAALAATRPEDSVFVYFAGHGVADGDRFYVIPADIAYDGPREGVRDALPQVLRRGISDEDLERAFEPLDARHLTLVIDACQSGQAIGADGVRYGPMNSRGLAQLAYEKGMSILAAAQAYQAALESAQLGHGYLTFALTLEALQSKVADRAPVDGAITVDEWFEHAVRRVPQLQAEALGVARQQGRILEFESGSSASSTAQPGAAKPGAGGRLQTPRVFTKRDASASALVVARP